MPFEEGKSGNPAGRPRLPEEIADLKKLAAAELWGGLAQAITGQAIEGVSLNAAEIGAKVVEQAKEGSGYHTKLLYDRFLGQAPQSVDLTSQGEKFEPQVIILPHNGR